MKYLDMVKVINDKEEYLELGICKGMVGMLTEPAICFNNKFFVIFSHRYFEDKEDHYTYMDVGDIETVEDGNATDEQILKDLPKEHQNIWCKVENGYITNLKGERKNKIPYDYNS